MKQLESLKHAYGTNIALHLDKLNYLVGRLHRYDKKIPNDELIRRLKDSITEDTYKAVKT